MVGFEHEFGNSGVVFTARYTDRRIKRIIEDNAALSPEAYQNGLDQIYVISNVNKNQDLFKNPVQIDYVLGGPSSARLHILWDQQEYLECPGNRQQRQHRNPAQRQQRVLYPQRLRR